MPSFSNIPITHVQDQLSIAEISIFSVPLLIRLFCGSGVSGAGIFKRIFRDGIVMFCLVRIVGGALYLAANESTDSILIGALILESLGSTFLMGELTRLLVLFLDIRGMDFPHSHKFLRRFVQCLRIPILLSIIMINIAYSVDNMAYYAPLSKTSSLVILATFLLIVAVFVYMAVGLRRSIGTGMTSYIFAAMSLPFLFVRVIYGILGIFGADHGAFVIIWGDWKIFVGMSLVMEILVVAFLVGSGLLYPSHALDGTDEMKQLESQNDKLDEDR